MDPPAALVIHDEAQSSITALTSDWQVGCEEEAAGSTGASTAASFLPGDKHCSLAVDRAALLHQRFHLQPSQAAELLSDVAVLQLPAAPGVQLYQGRASAQAGQALHLTAGQDQPQQPATPGSSNKWANQD
jgi:hypothetical protein